MRKKKKEETDNSTQIDILAQLNNAGLTASPPPDDNILVIPTGIDRFDNEVLQIGGLPLGRFVEVYGGPATGKSNFAYRVLAQGQRTFPNKLVAYIDAEARFTKSWAERQGIDTKLLQYHRTNVIEEIGLILNQYVNSGLFSVVVLDSLGNTLTSNSGNYKEYYRQQSGKIEIKERPAEIAKMVTRMVQQLTIPASNNNTLVLVVNQMRDNIGVLYGPSETTPGGKSFGHDLTMRLRFSGLGADTLILDGKKNIIGMRSAVNVTKNTLGLCLKTDDTTHFEVFFDNGIEKSATFSILSEAIRKGIVVQSGAWFNIYDGKEVVRKIQGKDNILAMCLDDESFRALLSDLLEKLDGQPAYGEGPAMLPDEINEEQIMSGLLD